MIRLWNHPSSLMHKPSGRTSSWPHPGLDIEMLSRWWTHLALTYSSIALPGLYQSCMFRAHSQSQGRSPARPLSDLVIRTRRTDLLLLKQLLLLSCEFTLWAGKPSPRHATGTSLSWRPLRALRWAHLENVCSSVDLAQVTHRRLKVCVPAEFIRWNPSPQGDGIRRRSLWEVIRAWGRSAREWD